MAKVSENDILDKSHDWGLDPSNNLPYSGRAVQKFIKEQLDSKMGYFYYDATTNRYLVFSDEAAKNQYVADPTLTELVLGAFDAPFNYEATITLLTPTYVPILLGETGNYISFDFDVRNKGGVSTGESVNATWTFMKAGVKQTVKAKYRAGQTVTMNIDKYLSEGTNTVIVSIVGENTLAATSASVTYQVVNLSLASGYDISQCHDLQGGDALAEIPFTLSGYGTKIVEWYLDGVQLDFEAAIDEVTSTSANRTKRIPLSGLAQGHHSLQIRAYTVIDGEKFYSDTLYRDLMVYTGADSNPIVALSAELPSSMGIVSRLTLEGAVQYIPYTIRFAVYNPTGAATDVEIAVDGILQTTVTAEGGVVNDFTYTSMDSGEKVITFTAEETIREVDVTVEESSNAIEEITEGLELDLSASGKSNAATDRDAWTYGDYSTTFNGFQWNSLSGWNDGALVMGAGNSIDIDIAPLVADATNTGKTLEFEFFTTGVSDDNAVVCDLRDTSGTGVLITASKASLFSSGGKELSRSFKAEENIRVGFVINKDTGVTNKGLAFVYINGVNSGSVNFAATDNFMSSRLLHIGGSETAGVALRSLRFYSAALTDDQMLNNFMLYRRSVKEMMEVYDRNDIYEEGTENFSMDKLANQLPVMIVTGDIPALEATTDKDKSIVVDVEYINYQNPEYSFTMKNAQMQPQGTSSMGYPKKNFRLYTQKRSDTQVFDADGNEIQSKLYSFKQGAIPVDCWCFKADYAESSGTHNTGIARLWNDVMKNVKVDDEFVCRTEAQKAALENGYGYDVRTTIDGFPIIMAYRLTETSPLVFIGKYNFNNDKSTENVFGFRDIPGFDDTNMQCWEVLNNGHHLALFQDTDNFDVEWSDAFESRYPDTKTPDTSALKAFAVWLTTTTDFATEKWLHLDVYKMAAYYVYVMRFGAVDQMVKNAMFTSEDGQKFYYINYDNDTINGLRNDGYLMYGPRINRQSLDESYTTEVYAYAGHDSRLWNSLEGDTEFMQIVQVMDAALYNAGLTYDNVIRMFDEQQSAMWCERVYNRDAQYKYISPFVEDGTNNLFMLQGSRQSHRRWWLSKRFSYIDSLFVSGEYKSNVIEMKLANAPAGLGFDVTAGSDGNYGYGVNNVAVSYGIELAAGQTHTFQTAQVLNVGDPLRIYAAPDIESVDLSNLLPYMSTLVMGGVYTETLGTKLKILKIGIDSSTDSRRNTSLKEISELANAKKLETLDIEGCEGLTSLDLSGLDYLKNIHAYASGLTSLSLPDGSPVERLELPSTIQGLVLSGAYNLALENLAIDGGWSGLSVIDIRRCPNLSGDWQTVKDWYEGKTTEDSKCSFTMDNIQWSGVDVEDLLALGGIIAAGGVLSLKGVIRLNAVSSAQIAEVKAVFGEYVFVKGGELWVTAPEGVFITGAEDIVEGDSLQLHSDVVSEYPGEVEWSIQSGSGASITSDGLLTTTESGSTRNVVVLVKHIPTQGAVVTATATIAVAKAVRPEAGSISGDNTLSSESEYTLSLTPSGINREYSVEWSLSGEAYDNGYVSISESDEDSCKVVLAEAAGYGDFMVTASVTTDKGTVVTVSKEAQAGTSLSVYIASNQDDDSVIEAVKAEVSFGSVTVQAGNGSVVNVPVGQVISVSFPQVEGYSQPQAYEYVSTAEADSVSVTYSTTVVTVIMADNQISYNDIASATATVEASGIITATVSSNGTAKVPTGASCTVTWSSVSGYRTPDAQTFTASGTSVTRTGTYQTEILTVTVKSDIDLPESYTVTVSGVGSQTTASKVYKIPFGTSYTVSATAADGYTTPASQSFTASNVSRSVEVVYYEKTVEPPAIEFSGTDLCKVDIFGSAITATTANCYVVSSSGTYAFPLAFGNAWSDGIVNKAAYTKVDGSYSHDFVDYNDTVISSPYIEDVSGTASGVELSMADTDNIFTDISLVEGTSCRYVQFSVANVPSTGANGVISILDGNGTVMWSWHIWVWPDDLTPVTITNNTGVDYNILPVNLATKKSTTAGKMFNWFYQWGRFTPMLPPEYYNSNTNATNYGTRTFTVSSAQATTYGEGIQNPQMFYNGPSSPYNWFGSSSYYNLWDAGCTSTGNSDNTVVKTVYDPCPAGFRMPNGNTFTYFSKTNVVGSFSNGWYFKRNADDTTGIFFPASGYRSYSDGSLSYVGKYGSVWLSSASSQNQAYNLYFLSSSVNPQRYNLLSYGYSVRPVQE